MDTGSYKIPVYYHEDYERHRQVPGHPESPERVREIMKLIKITSLPVSIMQPEKVSEADLELVHSRSHIERIRDFGVGYMDPDTFHTDETFGYSVRAAGGVLGAARQCVREGRPTFAIPRPPGHHAGYDYNMGFCYLNSVALSARMIQRDFDEINRVAIVDIDAHHGNGTNDIFYSDPSVLYISTHQWGIFPGTGYYTETGSGDAEGKTVNIPLQGGSGDPTFRSSFEEIVVPILDKYGPDLILVSLGADSHIMDPLTSLNLSTPGYLDLTRTLLELAEKRYDGRICFEMEGGYHTLSLAETIVGTMAMTLPEPEDIPVRFTNTRNAEGSYDRVKTARESLSSYWDI